MKETVRTVFRVDERLKIAASEMTFFSSQYPSWELMQTQRVIR